MHEPWWPSRFGPDDQVGMLNHVDDAKRAAALSLVREGRLYDLSRVLDEHVPVFPGRYFRQTLVSTCHHTGGNWITELVTGTMQLGTHLDTLGHLQIGRRGYNGWTVEELAGGEGLRKLGAETAPQIVHRGRPGAGAVPQVVARGRRVDVAPLGIGDVIGPEALDGVDVQPGDAVFFHTGWG